MKARDEKCEVSVVEFGNTSMEEKYCECVFVIVPET